MLTFEQTEFIGLLLTICGHIGYFIWYQARQGFRLDALEAWKDKHDETISSISLILQSLDGLGKDINEIKEDMKDVFKIIFDKIDRKIDKP